jgi:hypothetical protein
MPFLVTELAQKGSLQAVLANKGISLSWKERLSAAHGAASGMEYVTPLPPPSSSSSSSSSSYFVFLRVSDLCLLIVVSTHVLMIWE